MTKDYIYVKEIKSIIDTINNGIYRDNMKLSLTTEIVDDNTYCTLYLNNGIVHSDYAKEFNQDILWALNIAFHCGYMQGCKR